jgi:solute:Na+ symporter, SSS family
MIELKKIDLIVFSLYFLAFIFLGLYAGRKHKSDARDFFITRNRLPWYIIGFSIIASGISSEQFLGTVGFAFSHGISVANWEWGNGPSLLILVFLFIPFYLRKNVMTMPHFLEKRYDGKVRTLFALIAMVIYIFINLAGVTYAGGFALHTILGINKLAAIWLIAGFAGFFVIYGGMEGLAWTNVFQACMLLASGLFVTAIGIATVPGGIHAILGAGDRAHLILPASDPDIPWTGLIAIVLSTNIWYYCTSQNINQSTLGAKNEWHAKIGVIFTGILWLLIPFADTFPGMIAHALDPGIVPDSAFPYVINRLIPAGITGIMLAVLCASVITAIQAGINGVSTIFTFDFYKRFFNPDASEKNLILAGRIFAATVLIIGALWAPMVGNFGQIFSYFQQCWAFIAIPIAVTFVAGLVSKKIHARAAYLTLMLTFPMLVVPYFLNILKIGWNPYNIAAIMILPVILFIILASWILKRKELESDMVWAPAMNRLPETIVTGNYPVYKRVSFWATIMILLYISAYVIFW